MVGYVPVKGQVAAAAVEEEELPPPSSLTFSTCDAKLVIPATGIGSLECMNSFFQTPSHYFHQNAKVSLKSAYLQHHTFYSAYNRKF